MSGNSAGRGGGIHNVRSSQATLTNSTVSGNSASFKGGGIINYGASIGATTTLTNSIVANSLAGGDCSGGGIIDGGNNFSGDCSGSSAITPGVDIDTTLADNGGPTETHALLAGSVAIDAAGACAASPPTSGVCCGAVGSATAAPTSSFPPRSSGSRTSSRRWRIWCPGA